MSDQHVNGHAPSPEERALDALTAEMKDASAPDVDFDRLERELFARLDAGEGEPEKAAPPRSRWVAPAVVVTLAAAAAIALVLRGDGDHGATARAVPPSTGVVAKAVDHAPKRVDAGDTAATFEKTGFASWRFEPHSRASFVEEDARIVVTLESGAVVAEVVPQNVPERFVVVVDRARVAVHGTHFRVAKSGDHVDVDVSRGVVAMGADVPSSSPTLVTAPGGGTIGVDGTMGVLRPFRAFDDVPAMSDTSERAPAAPRSARPPRIEPSAPPPVASASAPATAPELDPSALRQTASSLAATCFANQAKLLSPNVNLLAETKMHLAVDASGAVSVSFEPELAPAVVSCVRDGLASVRATSGFQEIPLSLSSRR